jgi:hypothetical protein
MMMDRQRWEKEVGDGDGDTMEYELIEMTGQASGSSGSLTVFIQGFRVFVQGLHRRPSGSFFTGMQQEEPAGDEWGF